MRCPQCGAENEDGATFCYACGTNLQAAAGVPSGPSVARVPGATPGTKMFSDGEALKFGWRTALDNLGFFIALLLAFLLLVYIPVLLGILLDNIALQILLQVVSWVLSIVAGMGLIRVALKFADNQKGQLTDLLASFPLFFKYLFGSILYGLIVLAGLILLIIPGIIWAIKYQFYSYLIVDKGLGPIEALKASGALTSGARWDLLGFFIVALIVLYLGALALLVGLFVTIPTWMVATAFVYRRLLAQTESVQALGRV